MKKEVGCKYCSKDYNVLNPDTIIYSDIEMSLFKDILRVRVYEEDTCTFRRAEAINIKYCPFCGRKLEEK